MSDKNYLELSDDEVMNMIPPEPTPEAEVVPAPRSGEEAPDTPKGEATGEVTPPVVEPTETPAPTEATPPVVPPTDKQDTPSSEGPVVEPLKTSEFSSEAAWQKISAPFKANGREMTITDPEDVVALMKMGANYNKKMAALKPNLKVLKMLENHGLLDADKLSYLVDLHQKNPDAITKLVKESGLNPLDLNTEAESVYVPTAKTVDDRELELDAVLDDIQGTDSYSRTLNIVSKVWDASSKQTIANQPQVLKVINEHVQLGIYDLINEAVDKDKTLGRLNGLSDIEAYRQVGDRLNAQGAFNHLIQPDTRPMTPSDAPVVPPKPKMGNEDKLREDRKRAASTPQPAPSTPAKKDGFNPLAMSDAEFAKQVQTRFL